MPVHYELTQHAVDAMTMRGITAELLESVLAEPQQIVLGKRGRKIYQSIIGLRGRQFLLRVVVVERRKPIMIPTIYLTNQISRYWQEEPSDESTL